MYVRLLLITASTKLGRLFVAKYHPHDMRFSDDVDSALRAVYEYQGARPMEAIKYLSATAISVITRVHCPYLYQNRRPGMPRLVHTACCMPYPVLRSCVNRNDHDAEDTSEARFLKYVRIFFTEIAVLQSFLGEIDPAFVVCHDWDNLREPLQASKIAEFVSPNDEVADMISTAMVDTVTPSHGDIEAGFDVLTFDGAGSLVARLQEKLDSFEAIYCGPKQDA